MTMKLHDIKALGEDKYEVTLVDDAGATERIVCQVLQHKGVPGVRVDPDIFMTNQPPRINSQEVVKAVLAYHHKLVSHSN